MSDPGTAGLPADDVPVGEPQTAAPAGEKKHSSTLLNVIMILLGIIFFLRGVFDFLTWLQVIPFPGWLQVVYAKLGGPEAGSALSFLGPQAIIASTLGFWALVSGILMFREKETGWGMAIVILSTITLMGASTIIGWVQVPATLDIKYWPNWASMLSTGIGFFGFIWLLITRKRFT